MKIKMTRTEKGSQNGVDINTYEEGKTYDIDRGLALAFIDDMDCAKRAGKDDRIEIPPEPDIENQDNLDIESDEGPDIETEPEIELETGDALKDLFSSTGRPYKTEDGADNALERKGLKDTYSTAPVEGGFILRPKVERTRS